MQKPVVWSIGEKMCRLFPWVYFRKQFVTQITAIWRLRRCSSVLHLSSCEISLLCASKGTWPCCNKSTHREVDFAQRRASWTTRLYVELAPVSALATCAAFCRFCWTSNCVWAFALTLIRYYGSSYCSLIVYCMCVCTRCSYRMHWKSHWWYEPGMLCLLLYSNAWKVMCLSWFASDCGILVRTLEWKFSSCCSPQGPECHLDFVLGSC